MKKLNLDLGTLPFVKIMKRLNGHPGVTRTEAVQEISNVRFTRKDALEILTAMEKHGLVKKINRDRLRVIGPLGTRV